MRKAPFAGIVLPMRLSKNVAKAANLPWFPDLDTMIASKPSPGVYVVGSSWAGLVSRDEQGQTRFISLEDAPLSVRGRLEVAQHVLAWDRAHQRAPGTTVRQVFVDAGLRRSAAEAMADMGTSLSTVARDAVVEVATTGQVHPSAQRAHRERRRLNGPMQVPYRVPPDDLRVAVAVARRAGVTMTDVVRGAWSQWVDTPSA